jgi:O-antigen ligase
MRTLVVAGFMLFVIVYAQRNWYRALCALIVFTALTEYPGLPNPLEAKGFNHWSIMLAAVTIGWAINRLAHPRPWSIPRGWMIAFGVYLLVECIAVVRLCVDLDTFRQHAAVLNPAYGYYDVRAVLVENLYAPMRYMLLGFLLLDGARTQERVLLGLVAVLAAVLLYALVVDKEIPIAGLAANGMQYRQRVSKWTNRHPNDLARIFCAAFWVGVSMWQLRIGSFKLRVAALASMVFVLLALGHTLSRGGYLAFVAAGLVSSVVVRSWRTLAVLGTVIAAVLVFAPSVTDRLMTGVDTSGSGQHDMGEVTAGRDVIWSAAVEGFKASPVIGHGCYGYVLSPALAQSLTNGGGEIHPHNAYLEMLLDHGILGALGRLAPFLYVLWAGVVLVRRRSAAILRLMGASAVVWVATTLVMGISGQHWGFTEDLFTFWCVAGLTARAITISDRTPRIADATALGRPRRHSAPALLANSTVRRLLSDRGLR